MDRRFAYWLGGTPDRLRSGEVVVTPYGGAERPKGKTSIIDFMAVLPLHTPGTVVVAAPDNVCDSIDIGKAEDSQYLIETTLGLSSEFRPFVRFCQEIRSH